jgi:hypothetical protein
MGSQIESVKSKAFTVILQDLLPSTQYELNVTANAVCDDNRLYPSDVSSAIFTTESVNDLGSFITIQSNVTSACFGKIFKMTCNHPDILAMHNQSDVFIDSYANWKRDGMILAIDDVTYSVEQHRTYSTLTVNFSPDDFSIPGSSNFSCYLRGKGNVQYERLNASVDIPGFPHSIEIDSDTDYVSWSQVIDCIPPVSSTAKFILSTEWPEDNGVIPPTPVSSNTYNTTISTVRLEQVLNVSEVDFSVTRYLHVFLDEQKHLGIHNNSYACFNHYFELNCTSNEGFSRCGASQPTWFRDGQKLYTGQGSTARISYRSATVYTLRIYVTEDKFRQKHYFQCGIPSSSCLNSSIVPVNPLRMALTPHFQDPADSTSDSVTLRWNHNKACFNACSYNVTIQKDGENATMHSSSTSKKMHKFGNLQSSTMYRFSLVAICDDHYPSMVVVSNAATTVDPGEYML